MQNDTGRSRLFIFNPWHTIEVCVLSVLRLGLLRVEDEADCRVARYGKATQPSTERPAARYFSGLTFYDGLVGLRQKRLIWCE